MSLFSLFLFILILLTLVIVHELGHFLAAKALGIRVDEFAFGFPPRLFSKKVGETEYVINALPLGGYVKIHGEDGSAGGVKDPRSLVSRVWWQQIIVLVAGVSMNMLLAFIIFVVLATGKTEIDDSDALFSRATDKKLVITEVIETGPAAVAGLHEGDEIIGIKGKSGFLTDLTTKSAIAFIEKNQDGVTLTYKDKIAREDTVVLAPVYGIVKDRKAIGVGLATVGTLRLTFFEAIQKGFHDTIATTRDIAYGFKDFFGKLLSGKNVADQVAGPIGIAKVVHKAEEIGLSSVAFLAALLSINLAFFNILPFPALDGGRSVIVLGEALVRKKMKRSWFEKLNAFGFVFLMVVFVVVTIKDIIHP